MRKNQIIPFFRMLSGPIEVGRLNLLGRMNTGH
jgi:hypothetical protein